MDGGKSNVLVQVPLAILPTTGHTSSEIAATTNHLQMAKVGQNEFKRETQHHDDYETEMLTRNKTCSVEVVGKERSPIARLKRHAPQTILLRTPYLAETDAQRMIRKE